MRFIVPVLQKMGQPDQRFSFYPVPDPAINDFGPLIREIRNFQPPLYSAAWLQAGLARRRMMVTKNGGGLFQRRHFIFDYFLAANKIRSCAQEQYSGVTGFYKYLFAREIPRRPAGALSQPALTACARAPPASELRHYSRGSACCGPAAQPFGAPPPGSAPPLL